MIDCDNIKLVLLNLLGYDDVCEQECRVKLVITIRFRNTDDLSYLN